MIAECNTAPCFTIDLSGVTFMGSTGLAMLVGIRKAATNAGMELRLDGTPARVSQLLQITGLADHFGVTACRVKTDPSRQGGVVARGLRRR
jgi:anti-sigma B factor antagonist